MAVHEFILTALSGTGDAAFPFRSIQEMAPVNILCPAAMPTNYVPSVPSVSLTFYLIQCVESCRGSIQSNQKKNAQKGADWEKGDLVNFRSLSLLAGSWCSKLC